MSNNSPTAPDWNLSSRLHRAIRIVWKDGLNVEEEYFLHSASTILQSPFVANSCLLYTSEEVTDEVIFAKFGRRAILNLRQTLASKILELEKDSIYNKYIDKVGTIINAEVYQIWKKEMLLLDDEGNELLLPKTEQIPSDFYRKGETARAVVARVDNKNNNPKIILSRTSPVFLQRLFEMEVPEINDGLITIKKIARIPGERAKIAVESYDDRIDPVGACVGVCLLYTSKLFRLALRITLDRAEAEDVVQDTMIRAVSYTHLDVYKRQDCYGNFEREIRGVVRRD